MSCLICNEDKGDHIVQIREKGAIGINVASELRGDGIIANAGDFVHKSCRQMYINQRNMMKLTEAPIPMPTPHTDESTKSPSGGYYFYCTGILNMKFQNSTSK